MTNKELYKFDYFTLDNYSRLIGQAVDRGFEFCLYDDENIHSGKMKMLWRHDVEFSPDIALQMAKIEFEAGVKATYFFQLHSEFYNILESHYSNIVRQIAALGHQVGLHFDAHYYKIATPQELDKYIELDKSYFEAVFSVKLKAFSFHNTTPFILSCEEPSYAGLINVYSSLFKNNFRYCADSTGFWRYEILGEVLADVTVKRLQVLTHDAMWSEEPLSPRKRVHKSIQDNADRVKSQYDTLLPSLGAKNIDD